jgi:hypothetical protein
MPQKHQGRGFASGNKRVAVESRVKLRAGQQIKDLGKRRAAQHNRGENCAARPESHLGNRECQSGEARLLSGRTKPAGIEDTASDQDRGAKRK